MAGRDLGSEAARSRARWVVGVVVKGPIGRWRGELVGRMGGGIGIFVEESCLKGVD